MLFLVLTMFIIARVNGDSRIVNGTDAEEGEFPYAVSLRRNSSHTCGGTILNEKFILTAAHCVCQDEKYFVCYDGERLSLTCSVVRPQEPSMFSVQYDMMKITREEVNTVDVKAINCHSFSSEDLIYDSAVLELEHPLPEGKWRPVELSKDFDTKEKHTGTIIGWGKLSHDGPISTTLQKMTVEIYDDETCGKKYDNKHHICFGASVGGACNGDSGTALIVDGKQVGIASFITDRCGTANVDHPNVYSRISTYYSWIKNIAEV